MKNNQLDVYHRAYKAFLRETESSELVQKTEKQICRAKKTKEFMDTVRYRCIVKTDWIEKIEYAIPYIEEAIKQNRQFILQTGETVLIEKAKRTSKASVEHLAHHSELITREPEQDGDIIPDKIYMAENINNYAVYENRFLYMLLCFTNEFVGSRYIKIQEMWNKFHSEFSLDKEIEIGKRKIVFSASLSENSINDTTTSYDKNTMDCLSRIQVIQQSLAALLQMPLMKEVSHAPMIKVPITRTNVLRMDNAFRNTVELFDFLYDYEGDGFVSQEFHQGYTSFPENVAKDFASVIALSSYLTYRHGGKLDEEMEQEYEAEQYIIREQKEKQAKERIENLREQLTKGEIDAQEYIFALEDRVLGLEEYRAEVEKKHDLSEKYKSELLRLQENEELLRADISALNKEKEAEQQAMRDEIKNRDMHIYSLEQKEKSQEKRHQEELIALEAEYSEKLSELEKELEKLSLDYDFCRARFHGLRQEYGLVSEEDDFTSKETFSSTVMSFS